MKRLNYTAEFKAVAVKKVIARVTVWWSFPTGSGWINVAIVGRQTKEK